MIEVKDRVSTYPGRVKLTRTDGSSEYVTLERADSPTQEGTPLNKALFDSIATDLDGKANMINGEVPTASYLRLTGFSILNGVDLNTIKYTGQYGVMTNCKNRPVSTGSYDSLEVVMYSSHWLIQKYYVLNFAGVISGVYMRAYFSDTTWTPWKLYDMGAGNAIATASVE